MRNVFSSVGGALHPRRTMFDLSYEKKFTCDMGQLIPVMVDEVVPGDVFKIGNQSVVRFQPLVAPIMHEINQYVHYFFVPYRILWDEWEDFITGGDDGQSTASLPYWEVRDRENTLMNGLRSLWDYCGLPPNYDNDNDNLPRVVSWPQRAYNRVYNEFYRDETLMSQVIEFGQDGNNNILNRCWEKDYFTSSLPWQQRGVAPALPLTGSASAMWDPNFQNFGPSLRTLVSTNEGDPVAIQFDSEDKLITNPNAADAVANMHVNLSELNNNTVDLSSVSTFDVADLRYAFQIQKFLERNARCGARYTEFLKAHYGVSPRDERLQRPEYIGGTKTPVIISEVLQTSSTDSTSAQGNLAGHGISVSNQFAGTYRVQEYGVIIGIMSIMPRTAYQDGINRQWIKKTKYDFFFPEFANLSEQEIYNAEICVTSLAHDKNVFGFQGRYDEMRYKPSQVCAGMRQEFDYWHLGRQFDPLNPPNLNASFLKCVPRKDIFAVPSEDGLIISFGNIIKAFRPIPYQSVPGLIDHN